jgi:hypothetical protein
MPLVPLVPLTQSITELIQKEFLLYSKKQKPLKRLSEQNQ